MKSIIFEKFIQSFLFLIIFLSSFSSVSASELIFKTPSAEVGIGQEFYVDVLLDPKSIPVNGILTTISFPLSQLSFIRSEDARSMVDIWIEKPKAEHGVITLGGIMTTGFSGVIDPFHSEDKLPGLIIRLVFKATSPGEASLESSSSMVTLYDGEGTKEDIAPATLSLLIEQRESTEAYRNDTESQPELNAYVIRHPNLFDNNYTLIIEADDEETGIKELSVKEGDSDWQSAESPYLLRDQERKSAITVRAVNYRGASTTVVIDPLHRSRSSDPSPLLFLAVLVLLILFLRKKKVRRKHD